MEELSMYEESLRLDVEHLLGGVVNLPFDLPEMPAKLKDAFEDRWPSGCGIRNFGRLLRVEFPKWMYSIWEKTLNLPESEAEQVVEALCDLDNYWSFAESFAIIQEKHPDLGPDELREQALASLYLD